MRHPVIKSETSVLHSGCVENNAQGGALLTLARSSPKRGESRCHHLSPRKSRHDGAATTVDDAVAATIVITASVVAGVQGATRVGLKTGQHERCLAGDHLRPAYEVRGGGEEVGTGRRRGRSQQRVHRLSLETSYAVFQATNRTDSAAPDSRGPTTYRVLAYTLRNGADLQPPSTARGRGPSTEYNGELLARLPEGVDELHDAAPLEENTVGGTESRQHLPATTG